MNKRKSFSALCLSGILCLALVVLPARAAFDDVPDTVWYAGDVNDIQQYGIIEGVGNNLFDPERNMTLAEAVTLTARTYAYLHGESIPEVNASPWYLDYFQYADEKSLCSTGEFGMEYDGFCDRLTMATLFSRAFPRETEQTRNTVTELPDVQNNPENQGVFYLYEQGVLTGYDSYGSFRPYSFITRAEASAILNRVLDPTKRKEVSLEPLPGLPGLYSHVSDYNVGSEFGPSKGWLELREDWTATLFLEDVAFGPVSGTYGVNGSDFSLRLDGYPTYYGTTAFNQLTVNIPFDSTDDFYTFARQGSAQEEMLREKALEESQLRRVGMNDTYAFAVELAEEHFAEDRSLAAAQGAYYGRLMCALYDIDGNGVEELLVTYNNDISLYAVYTISGASLKNLAVSTMPPTFDLFDCWYLGGNGTLCHEWQTEDVYTTDFYRVQGASLQFIEGYAETDDDYYYSKSTPAYGRSSYDGFASVSGYFIENLESRYPGVDLDNYFYPLP